MTEINKLDLEGMTSISLDDLKKLKPAELIKFAKEVGIENAGSMRKQEIFVAVLKDLAEDEVELHGGGVLEVLQDGFGFLRAPEANYLPGPDDIYVNTKQIRKFGLRTGDTVSGEIRAPQDKERYFAMSNVISMNFGTPEQARNKAHFDSLTPLYPEERMKMEIEDPTLKDISGRIIDIVAPIGKGQRALIVDDIQVNREVLMEQLRAWNIDSDMAFDGVEALTKLKTCLLYTSPSPRD